MAQFTSQAQLIEALREQLSSNQRQVLKALICLFDRQTEDEKIEGKTSHNNGVGFKKYESEFLSSLAKQYLAKGYLSEKQIKSLMKILPKYARQLVLSSIDSGKIRKEGRYYIW